MTRQHPLIHLVQVLLALSLKLGLMFFLIFGLFFTLGCAGKPSKLDFALSDAALIEARKVKADSLVPQIYIAAVELYSSALKSYEKRQYQKASALFAQSRYYAEMAIQKAGKKVKTNPHSGPEAPWE